MQINEITLAQLNEAGILDTVRAAVSKDPALASLPFAQRVQRISQDRALLNLSAAILPQWNNYTVDLIRGNGNQPLTPEQYSAGLQNFVEKFILKDKLSNFEPQAQQTVAAAIQDVTKNKDDKKTLADSFGRLIPAVMTASTSKLTTQQMQQQVQIVDQQPLIVRFNKQDYTIDPRSGKWITFGAQRTVVPDNVADYLTAKTKSLAPNNPALAALKPTGTQPAAAQQTAGATQKSPAGQAQQFLGQVINAAQQKGLSQYLKGVTVNSTGNAEVDDFLGALGVKVR